MSVICQMAANAMLIAVPTQLPRGIGRFFFFKFHSHYDVYFQSAETTVKASIVEPAE